MLADSKVSCYQPFVYKERLIGDGFAAQQNIALVPVTTTKQVAISSFNFSPATVGSGFGG